MKAKDLEMGLKVRLRDGTNVVEDRILESVMAIPGGVRHVRQFPDSRNFGGRTHATAYPLRHPHPSHIVLLDAWLALCPRPELPIVDSGRMRLFLHMVPDDDAFLWRDSRNVGGYDASYLEPANAFLSSLSITNDGIGLHQDWRNGRPEFSFVRLNPPHQNGWLEFAFQVLAATNHQGIAFPSRAFVRRMVPGAWTGSSTPLRTVVSTDIDLMSVGDLSARGVVEMTIPSVIRAEDLRPPDLPKYRAVSYEVTNDLWRSVSDPELTRLAIQVRRSEE
jgi:hypothetical protein